MKKIILGMTGIALCVCLTACGKGSTPSSVSNLSNQLDSTANTLSSISSVSPTQITLDNQNKNSQLFQDSQLTRQSLLNEQYYKTEILERATNIKNNLPDIKLSQMQKVAINDLTNTLNKYTSAIENSKYEMNASAKAIASMKKNTTKNEDKLKAKYNRLACNSNMRYAYYENILSTLDEIENCLNLNGTSSPIANEQEQSSQEKDAPSTEVLKKNIDTYQTIDETDESADTTEDVQKDPRRRAYHNPNKYNRAYNNRFERFNPSRNTDTYGPSRRNIDSFGGYGNGYGFNGYNGRYGYNGGYGYNGFNGAGGGVMPIGYGAGYGNNFYAGSNYGNRLAPSPVAPATLTTAENTAEERLETYEKANPDNTVEKIEKIEKSEKEEKCENCQKPTTDKSDRAQNLSVKTTSAPVGTEMIRKMHPQEHHKNTNKNLDKEIVAH